MLKYCETEGCTNIIQGWKELCDECMPPDPFKNEFDELKETENDDQKG